MRGVAEVLIEEWRGARERHGWAVGRYVIMPDHVHFFCRSEYDPKTLPEFTGAWKRYTSSPGTLSPAAVTRRTSVPLRAADPPSLAE